MCVHMYLYVCAHFGPQNSASEIYGVRVTVLWITDSYCLYEYVTSFLPLSSTGCANSPCFNSGACETRPRPGEPNNPDFYCICPPGFIGQDCSQAVGVGM